MNELRDLAYIPYMIISQKDGVPIIGMVQDVLLGAYRISDDKVKLDAKAVANLQMVNSLFSGKLPSNTKTYTGKEIYSMILPPNMNTDVKKFKVVNSLITSGKLNKHSFKSLSSGLIPMIYHDFGPSACRNFMDNTQRLICRWLMLDGFSVGLSDLMMDTDSKTLIKNKIKEFKENATKLLDDFRCGRIKNDTIYDNEKYIENRLINIGNMLNKDVENLCMDKLNDDTNRMINMVNSGSKGKTSNVTQIMGCVAQIKVEGKRIPYGFTGRTLPHYTKYDDGPEARGFVENGFIEGLTPQEVFFHAMGGREGLIDTAVKSVTGDTPIIIIENGETKYINIGEWIDSKIDNPDNKTLVEQFGPEDANMEMLGLFDTEAYIPSCYKDGNIIWGKMTNVSRHDSGDILYEIITKSGRNIKVTKSKSLVIWDSDKKLFVETETPDVKIGDAIPVSEILPEPPDVIKSYIDMSKYFPKNEYIFSRDLFKAKDMIGNTRALPGDWYEKNNGTEFTLPYPNQKALRRSLNEGKARIEMMEPNSIYAYGSTKITAHIPDMFDLDFENGVFIGLFLADGNARIKQGDICITKNEEGVIEFTKQWFTKFGINYRIDDRTENRRYATYSVVGYSTILARFLEAILGHTAEHKYVPDFAITAPIEFVKGIISGYFSGDGNIDTNTKTIQARSISEKLINTMSNLCARVGIFAKISKTEPTIENRGEDSKSFHTTKPSYVMYIRAKWAVKFKQEILLVNNDKQTKLNKLDITKLEHSNFPTHNDVVLDEIVDIKIIPQEIVASVYPKAYDVTVPETGMFSSGYLIHCMNTSDTGYIERRLVKSMEDTKIYYDFTVRNATGVIVQFLYGEDGFDGSKVETQELPIIDMNMIDMVHNYLLREEDELSVYMLKGVVDKINTDTYNNLNELFKEICEDRERVITKVFNGFKKTDILYPISFKRILLDAKTKLDNANIKRRRTNLSPEYVLNKIKWIKENLIVGDKACLFFRLLVNTYLNPKQMICHYGFSQSVFNYIVDKITRSFKQSIAHPGEMVGIVAAQTIGEIGTQMTLDSFHVSGTDAAVNATSGVPRLKELLSVSKNIKTPTMFIYLQDDISKIDILNGNVPEEQVEECKKTSINVKNNIEVIRLCDVVYKSEIYWDDGALTNIEDDKEFVSMYRLFSNDDEEELSSLVLRLLIDKEKMLMYDLQMIDLYTKITMNYSKYINCIYSDDNAEQLIMRIKLDLNSPNIQTLCGTEDYITILKAIEYNLIYNMLVKGTKGIKKVSLKSTRKLEYDVDDNMFKDVSRWSLNTDGTNMKELFKDINIVYEKSSSNDIREIYNTLGIEAARKALILELDNVIGEGAINYRHLSLLVDTMTNRGQLMSIDRHGINRSDVGPLAKCSFEETTDMLVNASIFSEYDQLNGVSANVMLGHKAPCGTSDFDIIIDEDKHYEIMKDIIIPKSTIQPIMEDEVVEDIFVNVNIPQVDEKQKECFNRFS